jgi:hypothetical protein
LRGALTTSVVEEIALTNPKLESGLGRGVEGRGRKEKLRLTGKGRTKGEDREGQRACWEAYRKCLE